MISTLEVLKPERVYKTEDIVKADPVSLVTAAEAEYQEQLDETARAIIEKGARLILLVGPSSSGKTTTSKRLGEALERAGRHTVALSLDDFSKLYMKKAQEYQNGKPYYEGISNIDVELLHTRVREMFDSGRSYTPVYSFKTGYRSLEGSLVEIGPEDAILIEGIQALIPQIAEGFEDIIQYRVYAGIRARYEDNGSVAADTETIRFIRRLVRDAYFRRSIADRTFDIWENVMYGNTVNIWPYLETVDKAIDTSFSYEPCVMISRLKLLAADEVRAGTRKADIEKLIDIYGRFPEYDQDIVPSDSMLREFIGGLDIS